MIDLTSTAPSAFTIESAAISAVTSQLILAVVVLTPTAVSPPAAAVAVASARGRLVAKTLIPPRMAVRWP